MRVASSKELAALDLGKEKPGESYYQIKGPFPPPPDPWNPSKLHPQDPSFLVQT